MDESMNERTYDDKLLANIHKFQFNQYNLIISLGLKRKEIATNFIKISLHLNEEKF